MDQAKGHKNVVEALLGVRFEASNHWDPHPLVGISAFFLGLPAATFVAVELCIVNHVRGPHIWETQVQLLMYPLLAVLFGGAVVTCGLADYVYVRKGHRSFYGKIDVVWAAIVFLVSVLDFSLRASAASSEVLALSAAAILAFVFSGSSASTRAWVVRHTLWHAVVGVIGVYGSLRFPPEQERISGHLSPYVFAAIGVYVAVVVVSLAAYRRLSENTRKALWTRGASHADWQVVVTM